MESDSLHIFSILFFYCYLYSVYCIENSDTFVKIQKCSVPTVNVDNNLPYYNVRSKLECLTLCKSSEIVSCKTFEIYGNKNYTCVLRADCNMDVCNSSTGTTVLKLVYQTVNCDTTSTPSESTPQSVLTTPYSTVQSTETTAASTTQNIQTTTSSCGVAGTMVNGVCQCERGCSGTYCDNCYTDCSEGNGIYSGVVDAFIKPTGILNPVKVLCNFDHSVTYIQYRRNGDVNFNRSWSEYENGFGDVNGDFWLGNKYIRALAQQKNYIIGLRQYTSSWSISSYPSLAIDSATNFYALTYGSLISGTDGLSPADTSKEAYGQQFSTYDRDPTGCAKLHGSGWWYNTGCSLSNLNGNFQVTFGSTTGITQTGIGIYTY